MTSGFAPFGHDLLRGTTLHYIHVVIVAACYLPIGFGPQFATAVDILLNEIFAALVPKRTPAGVIN